jgi:hypothetical protein
MSLATDFDLQTSHLQSLSGREQGAALFMHLGFDSLVGNRNRLGVSLTDARFVAKLKADYEKSLAVLLLLKERLAFTDRVIDQIVYRMCGQLTKRSPWWKRARPEGF